MKIAIPQSVRVHGTGPQITSSRIATPRPARTAPGRSRMEYAETRRIAVARRPSPTSQAPSARNSPNRKLPPAAATSSEVAIAQTSSATAWAFGASASASVTTDPPMPAHGEQCDPREHQAAADLDDRPAPVARQANGRGKRADREHQQHPQDRLEEVQQVPRGLQVVAARDLELRDARGQLLDGVRGKAGGACHLLEEASQLKRHLSALVALDDADQRLVRGPVGGLPRLEGGAVPSTRPAFRCATCLSPAAAGFASGTRRGGSTSASCASTSSL